MKHTKRRAALHLGQWILAIGSAIGATLPVQAQNGPPGVLDPAFGSAGKAITDFFGASDQLRAVTPLPDGRFLAAGVVISPNATGNGSSPNVVVARFLPDGRTDPAFGTAGVFAFDHDGGTDEAHAMTVLSDRSILVSGVISTSSHSDFGLVKLTPSGALDTRFGQPSGAARTGYAIVDIAGATFHDEGRYVAVQSDGRIVIAGMSLVQQGSFRYRRATVARLTADGQRDTSFGGGTGHIVLPGFYTADPQTSDYVTGIALTQDGRLPAGDGITLVGYTDSRNMAFITRLTRDGQPDTSFAGTGRITTSSVTSGGQTTGASVLRGARIDSSGRIVVVGTANDRGFTFLRYLANGAPDTGFGNGGRSLVKLSTISHYDEPRALALQGNGKIVAAGYASTASASGAPQNDFFVVRLQENGFADPAFGDGQGRTVGRLSELTDEAFALSVEPSGHILAAGDALRVGTSQDDAAVLRAFGDPDRLFYDGFEQR
ncbi:hypothetical protein [Tahibacter amnicola]|uniref:Delta-60 repeat protein n=1 Tax=Tahibacter amnicola TaxID=2976241 RepID=A0ABY6BDM4_9GAMM|nr:hypothetical protein [Tahibacter amnicola]UXI66716.1 hypothetical protein N4264_18445 [Tahibacter amnicola]